MASIVTLPITLSSPPSGYSAPTNKGKLSAPVSLPVYPAGPSFIASARRQVLQRSFAEDDEVTSVAREAAAAAKREEADGEPYPGLGDEQESAETLARDPKEWKKQDHYAILGLGDLRYKANDEQIKIAHRRKILRHHPDKKAGQSGGGTNDDAFFKCIQKAHETLTNFDRRRQFDSVDWNINDEAEDPKVLAKSPEKFCAEFSRVFANEGRFSNVLPVPVFGGPDSSKKEVEGFYDFFYNFDSWRTFEWHDKEANEGSDSRDEKRFTEKKNKSERAKLKKEDNTRLRELVDSVLASDPRIKRIKAEEKAARDAKKKGTGPPKPLTAAEKKKAADLKKKEDDEKAAAEKKAAEPSKADKEAAKKAKEAARKNLKKWKKAIATVVSTSNYFVPAGSPASAATIEKQLAEIDSLVELLEPEVVKDLKESVEKAGSGEPAKAAIVEKVKSLGEKADGKFTEFA